MLGYHASDVRDFCREKGFDVELIHNPGWEADVLKTLEMGLAGVDDGVLIIDGDGYITERCLRNILKNEHAAVMSYKSHKLWTVFMYDMLRGQEIVKVSREKVQQFSEQLRKSDLGGSNQSNRMVDTISNMQRRREISFDFEESYGTVDLDLYSESDEGKKRKHLWIWRLFYEIKQLLYVQKRDILNTIGKMIIEIQKRRVVGYTFLATDPLTYEHLQYIQRCKFLCNYLVVGLYSDDLMEELGLQQKVPFRIRKEMVRAIRCVGEVREVSSKDQLSMLKQLVTEGYNMKKFNCMIRHLPKISEEVREYIRTIGGKVEGAMIIYSPEDERDQSMVFNRSEKL